MSITLALIRSTMRFWLSSSEPISMAIFRRFPIIYFCRNILRLPQIAKINEKNTRDKTNAWANRRIESICHAVHCIIRNRTAFIKYNSPIIVLTWPILSSISSSRASFVILIDFNSECDKAEPATAKSSEKKSE